MLRAVGFEITDAIERFAVLGIRLASDDERHAGGGHEIALVGRVDEDPAVIRCAVQGADRRNARTVPGHAGYAVQFCIHHDPDLRRCEHAAEDVFRDVRLEEPLGLH